ncbi:MAG: hypothetical protein IKN64_03735 [Desulfovibrio sp.]|nr:hypothetical protein [Desulfovibrio sp.]
MLEVAASPAYKDLLDAIGKLTQWTEQAGKGALPSGPPPAELVQQFTNALQAAPVSTDKLAVQSAQSLEPQTTPKDIIASSKIFQADAAPSSSSDAATSLENSAFERPRRATEAMTQSQTVNLERGMQGIEAASQSRQDEFMHVVTKLSEILGKQAANISPIDLIQAQRLVGVLRVQSESGRKLSEGVGETFEQLLDQQG